MCEVDKLNECLKDFTETQVTAIAEMIMTDCVLGSVWQDAVYHFIKENCWAEDRLCRAIVERVQEVTGDLMNAAKLTSIPVYEDGEESEEEYV
ncbi:hypothetical protein ACFL67_00745 [candidate division KSB1 bacterium]